MNKYDNSQIAQYQACPFSYYLQYVLGLRKVSVDDSTASKQFGTFAHKFWQESFLRSSKTLDQILEGYTEPQDIPQYSLNALKYFCDTYHNKFNTVDADYQILEVENRSEFPLGQYQFIVKKDGAFKTQENIFGLEHKTTGSLSYNYFDKYFLNSQISAQCYDTTRLYGQCSGILLNVGEIKFLKRKPSADYDGVLQENDGYVACKFQRDFITRSPDEIQEWEENTIKWIDRIELAKKNKCFERSTGLWGGMICSKCQYKELCKVSIGKNIDESVQELLYEECDPLEYLQTNNVEE